MTSPVYNSLITYRFGLFHVFAAHQLGARSSRDEFTHLWHEQNKRNDRCIYLNGVQGLELSRPFDF